jgi:signal transduction histidine kinase
MSILGGSIALVALLSAELDWHPFHHASANFSFKVNAAVAVVLLALAALTPRWVSLVFASLAIALGVAILVEHAVGANVGIDRLFFTAHGGAHPGRPSVGSAVAFVVLGIARFFAVHAERRWAQILPALTAGGAALVILGYVYDVRSLFSTHPLTSVAFPGAAAMLLVSLGHLAAVRDGAVTWFVHSRDGGAQMLRLLVPFAFLGMPALGYFCLTAERHGALNTSEAVVTLVLASALAISVVTWMAAKRLARLDRGRLTAIDDLTRLTDDLENQVQRRASQLEQGRAQLAILEDRHRIASDLHDIVIQRLFAAGMYLEGAAAMVEDAKARERIETAVEAMDTAIKDLRASIFELGSSGDGPVTLDSAVNKVGYETSRVLGFVPMVEITDLDGRAEPARDDILAVVREALSNIARHARATKARVTLVASVRGIVLTIEDDGQGMGNPTRASGTSNMRDRARRWGGNCVWESVDPHGTRVVWTIPDPVGQSS